MNSWPILSVPPVALPPMEGQHSELWQTLIELSEIEPRHWTLIGGQMVFLHALENNATPPRISLDLDVLVNPRVLTTAIPDFVSALETRGFELAGTTPRGVAHRYQRSGVSIDVLAPEGLGRRTNLTTTPPGRTIMVPGGTQALTRTELLPVRAGDSEGLVPRPSLLGAIVGKAVAVDVDDVPEAQRGDLAFLLSLVPDPIAMQDQMTSKDLDRLNSRPELADVDHPSWATLDPDARARARAALAILTG